MSKGIEKFEASIKEATNSLNNLKDAFVKKAEEEREREFLRKKMEEDL